LMISSPIPNAIETPCRILEEYCTCDRSVCGQ
jgi:hypothetical protein